MLTGRAPYAIGVILIVAFVLLLIVFRSLVVALFSIAMNPTVRRHTGGLGDDELVRLRGPHEAGRAVAVVPLFTVHRFTAAVSG